MNAPTLPSPPAVTTLRTAGLLRTWLTVLQVILGVFGGLFALGFVAFGVMLLAGASIASLADLLVDDLGSAGGRVLQAIGAAALLFGLLYAVVVVLGVYLVAWAKDWEGQSAALATGRGGDPARLAALRATLGRWIGFSQWGMVAYFAVLILAVLVGAGSLGRVLALDPDTTEGAAYIAPFVGGLYVLGVVLVGAPVCVVNWLLLGAIRRFMDASTNRLLGAANPVRPSANTVGNWFIFLLVVIGLGALNVLASVPLGLLGAFIPGDSGDTLDSGTRAALTGVVGLSGVIGLVVYALYFLLALWSRSFALSLADVLDSRLSAPAEPLYTPPAGPAAPLS